MRECGSLVAEANPYGRTQTQTQSGSARFSHALERAVFFFRKVNLASERNRTERKTSQFWRHERSDFGGLFLCPNALSLIT